MIKGIVKWFNSKKGFGFISTEDGEDVFLHFSSIQDENKVLMEGEKVKLEIEDSRNGRQAKNVQRLKSSDSIYDNEIEVIFPEDRKKIEESVMLYPMGSYQIGEVARISALLYEQGVNVVEQLKYLCEIYNVKQKE